MVDTNPARGMPLQLQRYWLVGKGAAKIRWDTPGDFMRCVHHLGKYFPTDPKGLCNILHTKATGASPGHGPLESLLKPHHTAMSLTAAAALQAVQPTGDMWAGPLAPIGRPTGDVTNLRQFDPGALMHRSLPLPLSFRRSNDQGHKGGVTVGRILGVTQGPDENGQEWCWGWGDWLDPNIVPEVKEAQYLVNQGVSGPSVDPGGPVSAIVDPETGIQHMQTYTIGGATLVSIPAFASMRLRNIDPTTYADDDADPPASMYAGIALEPSDCGCGPDLAEQAPAGPSMEGMPNPAPVPSVTPGGGGVMPPLQYAVNPTGWKGLPLASRDAVFDNDDAVKRIGAWAGVGTNQPDIQKMTRAFMWRDTSKPDTDPTAYRLPLGDVINGKLTLIFHAIYAAAALLSGAHGGLPDIPENEKNDLRREITAIYQAMANEFGDSTLHAPWDRPQDEGSKFAMADNTTPQKPYGDVKYADPGYQADKKKRYPIDTADHVRAAWSYINKKNNAGKYNPADLAKVKAAIAAAAKKLGIEIAEPPGEHSLLAPPASWFDDPVLPGKTQLTVEPNGQVYGHLAAWNECHRDVTNQSCVLAPKSYLQYAPFHLGSVRTAEGDTIRVGKIVMDTRHASINLGYMSAAIHYDNTGDEVAVVRAGEDEYGIWVAGAVVPEATPRQIAKLRRSPLSGDWRGVEGHLELTAALAVNVPAFPVYSMDGEEQTALVAAGTVLAEEDDFFEEDEHAPAVTALFTMIAEHGRTQEPLNESQATRAQWLADLKEDEEIYAQRERAARFAALAPMAPQPAAAPTGAPTGALPAPAAATPAPPAQAPQPPAPVPVPAAGGAPDADWMADAAAQQRNTRFSMIKSAEQQNSESSEPTQ